MADPRIRQIKIQTGVVKRLARDEESYKAEARLQAANVECLRAEAADEYFIRKQVEALQETAVMIPDSRRRLARAHAELLVSLEAAEGLEETDEYKEARRMLDSVMLEE